MKVDTPVSSPLGESLAPLDDRTAMICFYRFSRKDLMAHGYPEEARMGLLVRCYRLVLRSIHAIIERWTGTRGLRVLTESKSIVSHTEGIKGQLRALGRPKPIDKPGWNYNASTFHGGRGRTLKQASR